MKPVSAAIQLNEQSPAVATLHQALNALGFEVNGDEQDKQLAGDLTLKQLRTFQRKFRISFDDTLLVDETTAKQLNALLKEKGLLEEAEVLYTISGKVVSSVGVALSAATVTAFDKRMDADMLLGETTTDANGEFLISYSQSLLKGKARPDLQVRIAEVDASGVLKEIGRSDISYNAGIKHTLDVIIKAENITRRSEYEQLIRDLTPHLGRLVLKDLEENKEKEHITLLANKSGWDARAVAMVVQAHKLSAETSVEPAHYYALFRAGITGNTRQISKLSLQQTERLLKNSIEKKVISGDTKIAETLKLLRSQNVEILLKNTSASGVSSLGNMLSLRLNADQQKLFADSFQETATEPAKFWSALKGRGFDDTTISRLQLDGKLGYLTSQNAPLVKRLQELQLKDPIELAGNNLYKPFAWKPLIANDVPPGVQADEYAAHLANQVKVSYPTAVLAQMVRNDEVSLGNGADKQAVADFFLKNGQKFVIGQKPVKSWDGFAALPKETQTAAKTLERLYQLSPSDESLTALSKTGLTSAFQVAAYGKEGFINKFGDTFPSTKEALLTYNKASEVQAAVMHVATTYLTYRAAPNLYAITGKQQKQQNDIIAYPTLEELFDNMDYCACDHCKSVLSPAAYLVDLLQFIDLSDIPHDKQNPVNILRQRRPDIEHIQLSCENTNTILPYIDLVNEILEHYVINGNLTAFKGFDMAEDIQTADLLADPQFVNQAAYAEVKTKVYPYNLPFDQPLEALRLLFKAWDISLGKALETFSTPLAARLERMALNQQEYQILTDINFRALPEYFGESAATTLPQLNQAIANGKAFFRRTDIRYEELVSLLKTEFINPGIVLVPLLEKLTLPLSAILSYVDGNLTDAQLDAQLPAGLDTAPYNGDVKQWLKDKQALIMGLITLTDVGPESSECNFAEVQLRFALPDATRNQLDQRAYHLLHRFIRFWKKSGWSIEISNDVLMALTPIAPRAIDLTNIDATFVNLIARVANLKKLMEVLNLSSKKIAAILPLWDTSVNQDIRQEMLGKLLKIPVQDVLDLSVITGLNPLANDLETDMPSLPEFISIVKNIKAASLKITDLNYLLRHVDATGKLTPPDEVLLKHIKLLRDSLTAIEREHSVSPDTADFSFAREKMMLVYDAGVVDDFFGLLTHSKSYSHALHTTEEGLPAILTSADTRLGFDPFAKQLVYRGILVTAQETSLKNMADTLLLADVENITQQADLDTYIADIKTALTQIGLQGKADLTSLENRYPELKTVYEAVLSEPDPAAQTARLIREILPELKVRLKTNTLRQTLSGLLKAEAEMVDALTSGKDILPSVADPTRPIIHDFLALEQKLFFNQNQTYDFYLDAPATDTFQLIVKAPQNTVVTLTVNGEKVIDAVPVTASGEVRNAAPLSLKAGVLHPAQLILASLPANSQAELLWQTKGIAKIPVPAASLYAAGQTGFARTSLVGLLKSAQLTLLLKLTSRELLHFAAVNPETRNFLHELPTGVGIADAVLQNLWKKLKPILYFVALKKETEPDENTWVQVLENPDALTPQGKSVLLGIGNWQAADLNAVLAHKALSMAELTKLSVLEQVVQAMNLVQTIRFPAAKVISWATHSPTAALISEIKTNIRDINDDAAWLATMETVSNELRNKQRDALVSYVLFHKKPSPEVNTADKLFEYFLIDTQMDACMKTSRIKQAISTVQLFIYRCLMNLEPEVAPPSIRTHQWEWMKRYRVWEANRKVFLYPENWLEPELRDNKSSFFKELEGELLQSDITDDLAETAFLNYLKKLDDIARLQMVGMYLEENEQGNQDDDILHVLGRTNGNTRQHYYRRYEYGYWTPWEKVSLNIEGDHVFPIVWKKRLFVFWLNIFEKPADGNPGKSPENISDEAWGDHARKNVEVTMGWGEYYKNKWTSPKSSEMNTPASFFNTASFDRNKLLLYARKEKKANTSERLIFYLRHQGPSSVKNREYTFTYTSKNSPPVVEENKDTLLDKLYSFEHTLFRRAYQSTPSATRLYSNSLQVPRAREVKVTIEQPVNASQPTLTQTLLTKSQGMFNHFQVLPLRHHTKNQWEAPFFYEDEQSTFFMRPEEEVFTPLWRFEGYYDIGILQEMAPEIEIPRIVEEPIPAWPPVKGDIVGKPDLVSNPWEWSREVINKNPNFKHVLPSTKTFVMGENTFGVSGKLSNTLENIPIDDVAF